MSLMFQKFLFVFVGGGLGASLRWGTSSLVLMGTRRIWASTLIVNVIGSLVFLLLSKIHSGEGHLVNLFLKIGLLGGLTTFSSFSYEVVSLFSQGKLFESFLIVALNIIFGIVIGIWIFS